MPTLVVNQGAIGDLLLSIPALRLLRKAKGEFTLASNPTQGLFLKRAGEVSSVIPCTARAFSELYTGSIPPLLQYFDDIWWFSRRRGLVPDIYLRPSKKWSAQVVFTVDEGPNMTNCAKFQFSQVKRLLGMDDEEMQDFLYPMSFSRPREQRKLFDVVIHPGSGSRKKCWPIGNFLQTARELISNGHAKKILFILGPAEEYLRENIMQFVQTQDGAALYMEGQDLWMVADTLGSSQNYLGNDSGISHLAAWCGAESTILFGPTDAKLWRPPLSNTEILTSPARCSPCGVAYRKCNDVHCMEEIPVEHVISSVIKDIQRTG